MNVDRTCFYTQAKKTIISLKLNNAEQTGGVPKKGRVWESGKVSLGKRGDFSNAITEMNPSITRLEYQRC